MPTTLVLTEAAYLHPPARHLDLSAANLEREMQELVVCYIMRTTLKRNIRAQFTTTHFLQAVEQLEPLPTASLPTRHHVPIIAAVNRLLPHSTLLCRTQPFLHCITKNKTQCEVTQLRTCSLATGSLHTWLAFGSVLPIGIG